MIDAFPITYFYNGKQVTQTKAQKLLRYIEKTPKKLMFGEKSVKREPDEITIHTSYGNTISTVKCKVFCDESIGITNGNGKIICYNLDIDDTIKLLEIMSDS